MLSFRNIFSLLLLVLTPCFVQGKTKSSILVPVDQDTYCVDQVQGENSIPIAVDSLDDEEDDSKALLTPALMPIPQVKHHRPRALSLALASIPPKRLLRPPWV